ncbi:helix-turn-helix domain-containing protein [Virgibacillus ndiopensis]|uniref:helix-turn-helix domain-containing protein n=1 Tax=Virgibacillus ndiopensis TaxID=2004408 RepID=UPI00159BBF56|nr:helix-turn-helix transcriptional regulator [Virgibacillus ndiopensis]
MEQQLIGRIEIIVDDFGRGIKAYREAKGMTLDDLAIQIGCSASFIFRVEKGKRVVPVNRRIMVLKKGLGWKQSQIELYLTEKIKKYEQNNG